MTAKLLNRVGGGHAGTAADARSDHRAGATGSAVVGVAPGEYLLDLRATGQGGEAKQLVAFKIVSYSGFLGKNGRYHTFRSIREETPSEASS